MKENTHGGHYSQSLSESQLSSLRRLLALKKVKRQGWTRHPIPDEAVESVADHSYGVTLLSWLLCPPELDRSRVLELALIHDLAEIVTGDVTPHDDVPQEIKNHNELEALAELLEPTNQFGEACELLLDYQKQSSPEAQWVKKMDKLEMSLQSLTYEGDFSVDLSEFRHSSRGSLEALGLSQLCE